MPSIPRTPARPESVDGGACLAWLNMLLIPSLVRRYPHRFEHGADALHAQKASGETQNDKLAWLRARARNYADVATLLGELVEAVRAKNVAPKRPRGRPRIDEKKHDRIVKGWNPKQYPTYQDYANALGGGVTAKDVQRAVNREKKRRAAE